MHAVKKLAPLLCVATLALPLVGLTACGNDTKVVTGTTSDGQTTTRTVPDVKFAKAQFVLHTGLAIGAFKKWIYDPYQAGEFKQGAPGRRKALVKAALAGAFTLRELKAARDAALSDDQLRGVGDKLSSAIGLASGLVPGLDKGKLNATQVIALASTFAAVKSLAGKSGADVKEINSPLSP